MPAGSCGSGPNVALIPLDGTQPLVLSHVGTPQRMADLLRDVCGQQVGGRAWRQSRSLCSLLAALCCPGTCIAIGRILRVQTHEQLRPSGHPEQRGSAFTWPRRPQVDQALLRATELRLAGNAAAGSGDFRRAEQLYTQGLELQVGVGHVLLLHNSGCLPGTVHRFQPALLPQHGLGWLP
jgi:hypothetical protein